MTHRAIQLKDDYAAELSVVLHDNLVQAGADMAGELSRIREYREYLEAIKPRTDAPFAGACALVPPFVKESLLALQAEIAPALLNPQPFLRAELADLSPDHSNLWEAFYNRLVFDRMKARNEFEYWYYAGLRDGVSVMMVSWETIIRQVPGWDLRATTAVDPLTGAPVAQRLRRKRVTMPRVRYDYPRLQLIPIEQFVVYPAIDADVQRSELVGAYYHITGDDLAQGVLLGDYDEEAVRKAVAYSENQPRDLSPEDTLHGIGNNPNIHPNPGRNVLTVFEGCWRLPGKALDEPGRDYWVTYHADSQTILRARPLEEVFYHAMRPFVLCRPYANMKGLFADSVASSGAGHVQDAKMSIMRLAVDAATLAVNPPQLIAASMYRKAREALEENRKPGGYIPFPDQYFMQGGKGMVPYAPGISPTSIIPIMELLDVEGQKGTGATDTMKSIVTPNQITATQAEQIYESSKKLVGQLVEHCAISTGEVGQQIHELVRQFSDHDSVRELWQRENGKTGVPLEIAAMGEYIITANGISETSNKAILAQRAMARLEMLKDLPFIQQHPDKLYKIYHDALQDTGTRNPEDYLGTVHDWVQMSQQQVQAMTAMAQGLVPGS